MNAPKPPILFDQSLLRQRSRRAQPHFAAHDFLHREMAERLADRLLDVNRTFTHALVLGDQVGLLAKQLASLTQVIQCTELHIAPQQNTHIIGSAEYLPLAENSFDLILITGHLHWVNDLPGALIQLRHALKPDGLFLSIFPGGDTLHELRNAIMQGSMREEGGISPRVSPFIDVRGAGSLMQRAGFALPVVDSEHLHVSYPDALSLMRELRGMGEANALIARTRKPLRKDTLAAILSAYHETYADAEGRIPATFELITLTGWKPHASQAQPAKRGSGQVSLKEVLK